MITQSYEYMEYSKQFKNNNIIQHVQYIDLIADTWSLGQTINSQEQTINS